MTENIIETRILLRYGTYAEWMSSRLILKQGEAAVCAFPRDRVIDDLSNTTPENTPPAIGIKIGDGHSYFYELPWIQAIAADVYNWAKSSYKPTYTAQEIQGLQSFVENLVGGDVEVNIAPRIYQLTRGTDDNFHKYYLRYKENTDESPWVVDTSAYIDLEDLAKVVSWLGRDNLNDYDSMIARTADQIRYFLNRLNLNDSAQEGKFVTSVSEAAGIITVERAQPEFSDIAGIAQTAQGGTGRNTLTEDAVLVGNGTDPVKLIPIAESIANNNHLVPNYLIKAYVDNATAGITGAMHFVGEATVVITPNSSVDPQIGEYNFSNASPGDVILYESKEFVWTGVNWRLLGDEGSYAIKGSIRDADIDPDANIQQNKIANLDTTLDTKVDKVEGKTLSTNDFTDELKQKLDNIESGAQRNTIEHILVNDEEIRSTTVNDVPNTVNIHINEFDDASQQKLAGIAAGAEVNKIDKIYYDGEEVLPDSNRIVSIVSDPHTEHINKIESIYLNNVEWPPNANKEVRITLDQAALNLNVLEGATIPGRQGGTEEVTQVAKKLELARMAVTGNVQDLLQTNDTYIVLNCGTSVTVV